MAAATASSASSVSRSARISRSLAELASTTSGCTKAFLAHVRGLREQAVSSEFSVGWAITEAERAAIAALPARAWTPAVDATAAPRDVDEAALVELTGLLPATVLGAYPEGTRVIVRRERPHPSAPSPRPCATDSCT